VSTYADTISPTFLSGGDTAYCEDEAIESIEIASGTQIVWEELGVGITSTFGPHQYSQTIPAIYADQIDTIIYKELAGVTTLGVECASSEDTLFIAYHGKQDTSQLFYGGNPAFNLVNRCLFSDDEFSQSASPVPFSYNWYVNSNANDIVGSVFSDALLDAFNENSDSVLNYFNVIEHTLVGTKYCSSDTNQILVHTYELPVNPNLGLDTSYCFGEIVDQISPLNSANVHNLWWKNEQSGAVDSILTTSPHQYTIPTADYSYNDAALSIYARDSTGVECFSDYDTVQVSFHGNPSAPILTLNTNGVVLPADTLIEICPTINDTLYANILAGINTNFIPGTNPLETTDTLRLQDRFPDLSINAIDYYSSELQVAALTVADFTCYSDTNTVTVQTYATPVIPTILSGTQNATTVIYCEGDIVPDLFLLGNPTSAIWQRVTQVATQYGPSQAPVVPSGSFLGQTIAYTATDSTGTGCYSAPDLINLEFNPRPIGPNLSTADNEYCEGDNLLDIFAQDANPSPLICDWYVNDTTGSPIGVDLSQITPNYNFANDTTYIYYAHIEHPTNGCWSYFDTISITYHPSPDIPAINYTGTGLEYCPGELFDTLVAVDEVTWSFASDPNLNVVNDTVDLNDIPVTLGPGSTDIVQYFYTDQFNCNSDFGQVQFEIFNNPAEPIVTSQDYTYCEGDLTIAQFDALDVNGNMLSGTGTWYDSDGTQLSTGGANSFNFGLSPPLALGDTAVIFNYLDANGCLSINDTVTVTTYPVPAAPSIVVIDSVYCEGEEITALDELNGLTNTQWYLVQNNLPSLQLANSSTYTPQDSGTYLATIIENECESLADSVEIVIKASPEAPVIDDMQLEYCNDQLVDTIFITSSFEGTWFVEDDILNALATDTNAYLPVQTIVDSVTYLVNVLDPSTECYSEFDTITLYQFASAAGISTELAEICLGFTQELVATGGVTYAWSTLETDTAITVSPTFNTWYYVDIVDENNCKIRDSIEVALKLPASCEEQVYTAFSPNGDGVNETWEITGIEIYENPVVYIFNRWGDKIATIENYDNNLNVWDGTNQSNNQQVVYGTYYYIIEDGGTKVKDGWLQVVK